MANQIKIKRGLKSGIPTLVSGEPGWCTDTFELYVGDGATNRFIGSPDVLLKAGGTMSGFLVLHADPDSAMKAVTKKHTEGKLKADSTDPTAGFLDEKIDDSLVLVVATHKIRVQKLDGGAW